MAKTYGQLWPQVIAWGNLLRAYQKCRRRKRYKPDAARFDRNWEANLVELRRELASGSYRPGAYRHFYVFEPKRRKISAAPFRDRVVHHAVVNVLEPIFERRFIYDSYACRRGKGTHRALARAQQYLRCYGYYLKTDIVRFFPNVDHEILMAIVGRAASDQRLLALVAAILASGADVLLSEASRGYFPGDDLFAVLRPRGLPIGNLTSQFLANVLLDRTDHFVKDELGVPGYVRYADDMVLFADDKKELWRYHSALQQQLQTLRLRLHEHKTQARPSRQGLKFLGLVLWRDGRRLQQSAIRRFNRRMRHLRWLIMRGSIRPQEVSGSIRAWLAFAFEVNSAGVRRALWRCVRFSR